ncbi:MAG: LOG family protein [Bdellovibrionales bacterium]|nr:LOG family protein [Bdellovibrionales bacterium]
MANQDSPFKELEKARRRRLTQRLKVLRERSRLLELELQNYTNQFFRVCIFGSARIKQDDSIYRTTFELGELFGELGIDVLTGGGPGLMEAANRGALAGRAKSGSKSKSFGLTIELNRFEEPSEHLDIKHHHRRFSSRLDDFMRLSHAIVVVQGGIGTLLELFFAWQLLQVGHMPARPVILMDSDFWRGLIDWMREKQLGRGLVSAPDFDFVQFADTPQQAADAVRVHYEAFLKAQIALLEKTE